jgi:phosphoribosylaminoimidazolecarboxamide formyltransferase/IMP cyclohydrolase
MTASASPGGRRPVRRALISVYDKSGLAELAGELHALGVEIVSTGSTAARIAAAGVPVVAVESVTGFPECLDGRVKTLHPGVHAGLLADTRRPEHLAQLTELGIAPFDLLVSNLYPFTETVASGAGAEECVEQIDIGGPAMVRAAAKNHAGVAVVVDPGRYAWVVEQVKSGGFALADRRALAAAAFDSAGAAALGLRPAALRLALLGLMAAAIAVAVQGLGALLVLAVLVAPPVAVRRHVGSPGAAMLAGGGGAGLRR